MSSEEESMLKYEVSAQWMKACGFGDQARVFDVIRTYQAGPMIMVVVDHDGRPWELIASWRGRFVKGD